MNERALAIQVRWYETAAFTLRPRREKNGSLQIVSNRRTSTETCSYHMVVLQLFSCCQLKKDRCESVALANVRVNAVALASGLIDRPSMRYTCHSCTWTPIALWLWIDPHAYTNVRMSDEANLEFEILPYSWNYSNVQTFLSPLAETQHNIYQGTSGIWFANGDRKGHDRPPKEREKPWKHRSAVSSYLAANNDRRASYDDSAFTVLSQSCSKHHMDKPGTKTFLFQPGITIGLEIGPGFCSKLYTKPALFLCVHFHKFLFFFFFFFFASIYFTRMAR